MSLLNDTQRTATLVIIDKSHKIHFTTIEKQTMTTATRRVTDINFSRRCISVEAMTRKLVMANSAGDTIAICIMTEGRWRGLLQSSVRCCYQQLHCLQVMMSTLHVVVEGTVFAGYTVKEMSPTHMAKIMGSRLNATWYLTAVDVSWYGTETKTACM